MPPYTYLLPLPDGGHQLLARANCANDLQATDDLSACLYPEAQVWQGERLVGTLPPLRSDPEDLVEETVRFVPPRQATRTGSDPFDPGATLRRRPTWRSGSG